MRIFNRNKYKYYTFVEKEHEVILLQRLEDNRILFFGQIYESDFFHYEILEAKVNSLYAHRDNDINFRFQQYIETVKKSVIYKREPYKYEHKVIVKKFSAGKRKIWKNLTKVQYNILLNGFTFNYNYFGEPFKKSFPYIMYKFAWESVRIVSGFRDPLHWFYSVREKKLKASFNSVPLKKNLLYNYDLEWNYEQKLNELDYYSKTNTRARFIRLNEEYYNYLPDSCKFKTKDKFEYTEEEIKAVYDNVKNKTGLESFDFVWQNPKHKANLLKVKSRLEQYEDWLITEENPDFDDYNDEFSVFCEQKAAEDMYAYFNDPQNFLILPVIESLFALFDKKVFYNTKGEDDDIVIKRNDIWDDKHIAEFTLIYQKSMNYNVDFEKERKEYFDGQLEEDISDHIESVSEIVVFHILTIFTFVFLLIGISYFVFGISIFDEVITSLNPYGITHETCYELYVKEGKADLIPQVMTIRHNSNPRGRLGIGMEAKNGKFAYKLIRQTGRYNLPFKFMINPPDTIRFDPLAYNYRYTPKELAMIPKYHYYRHFKEHPDSMQKGFLLDLDVNTDELAMVRPWDYCYREFARLGTKYNWRLRVEDGEVEEVINQEAFIEFTEEELK